MLNGLLTLVLSPVLLPQGLWVRWTTPKLPEAAGDRVGVDGQGQPIRLLVLGDSAAAGVGVNHQKESLIGQIVSCLSSHYEVHWQLHATTGHTTEDVIDRIKTLPEQTFDVVVTSVGVNDVTRRIHPDQWIEQQRVMLSLLKERFQARKICVTPVPPMHVFPALPQPLRWCLGRRAAALNARLEQLLGGIEHCHSVDAISEISTEDLPIYPPINPSIHPPMHLTAEISNRMPLQVSPQLVSQFMASDGFHPSAALYRLWGEAVSRRIIDELLPEEL